MEQIKPDKRYLLASKEDIKINFPLKTNFNDLNEFNNSKLISLSDLFTKERNESTKYRLYGNINFVSFLRNKKTTITGITDLFNDDFLLTGFNFEDYFDLKAYRLATIQTTIDGSGTAYTESLTAITDDNSYKLSYFGFSRNIFNEKTYNFKFDTLNLNPYKLVKLDNDIIYDNSVYLGFIPKNFTVYEKVYTNKEYIDTLNPSTELGYSAITITDAQYNSLILGSIFENDLTGFKTYFSAKTHDFLKIYNIKINDKNFELNKRFIRNYLDIGNGDYFSKIPLDLTKNTLQGNFINFDRATYTFTEKIKKEYFIILTLTDKYIGSDFNDYIDTNYSSYNYTSDLVSQTIKIDFSFKFNPFHKIELKRYDTFLQQLAKDVVTDIIPPDNSINYSGDTIWRNLMTYGEPDNYDFPFINNAHYFFNDINFYLKPDLSDKNTIILMNEFSINFQNNNFILNKDNIKISVQPKVLC